MNGLLYRMNSLKTNFTPPSPKFLLYPTPCPFMGFYQISSSGPRWGRWGVCSVFSGHAYATYSTCAEEKFSVVLDFYLYACACFYVVWGMSFPFQYLSLRIETYWAKLAVNLERGSKILNENFRPSLQISREFTILQWKWYLRGKNSILSWGFDQFHLIQGKGL